MPADPAFESIRTERLTIRRFREDDLPALVAYRNDPDVARYQAWELPYTEEAAGELLAEIRRLSPGESGEWFQFAIEERALGVAIGDCGLRPNPADPALAEIGFTLAPGAQGHGYATEAVGAVLGYTFKRLGVGRIEAYADARNTPSIALLERVGMRLVATHDIEFKGELAREHVYELESGS